MLSLSLPSTTGDAQDNINNEEETGKAALVVVIAGSSSLLSLLTISSITCVGAATTSNNIIRVRTSPSVMLPLSMGMLVGMIGYRGYMFSRKHVKTW